MGKSLQHRRLGRVVSEVGADLLKEAREARPRVMDPEDSEGLHDFRVALRRLRAWLQAYRGQPGISVPKALRRDLRDLARATNSARDGEVMLAWLQEVEPTLATRERQAAAWWRQQLEGQVTAAYQQASDAIDARFPDLEQRLQALFEVFAAKPDGKAVKGGKSKALKGGKKRRPPSFGEATGQVLESLRERLEAEVARVGSVEEADALHRPRITGKRIRYLLRPWRKMSADCHQAERAMKQFQDAFGVLHDDLVRESAMQSAALEHGTQELEAALACAAQGKPVRATAPAHLRGFMDLLKMHRQRVHADYETAVGAGGVGEMGRLSMQLQRAAEAMRS